jgi:hypothetical protein
MAIPISPVSLGDIQAEFFGSNPIALSEYYRGGSLVHINQPNAGYGLIATSGALSVGTFRGAVRYGVLNGNIVSPLQVQYVIEPEVSEWSFTFHVNGDITSTPTGVFNIQPFIPADWYSPNLSYAGEFYWIRVIKTFESATTSPFGTDSFTGGYNTWLPMNINRTITHSLPPSGFGFKDVAWSIQIADDAAGVNILTSGSFRSRINLSDPNPGGDN